MIKNIDRMRHFYGPGLEGQTCGGCEHLNRHMFACGRKTYKCRVWLRATQAKISAASDWRKKWPACARFVEREK